MIGTQGSS